jgi:hypothetical protein
MVQRLLVFFYRVVTLGVVGVALACFHPSVYAAPQGVSSAAYFPILSLSPDLHSQRHLAEYRGRLPPIPSRMTAQEKALAADLWKLVNAGAIHVRAPHTSKYLFAVAAQHQLTPEQAIAFFYRAVVGTFEPSANGQSPSGTYVSPLKLLDQSFAADLQSKGLLLKHQIEASSPTISTTMFTVRKGHGRALRQRIASSLLQLNDPFLQADTLELLLVEDSDRDYVQWIYKD